MKDWRDFFADRVETVKKSGVTLGMRLRNRQEYEAIIRENLTRAMFDAIHDAHDNTERGNAEWDRFLAGIETEKANSLADAFERVMAAWPKRGDHYYYLKDGRDNGIGRAA